MTDTLNSASVRQLGLAKIIDPSAFLPCLTCTSGGYSGLPGNACSDCQNSGYAWPNGPKMLSALAKAAAVICLEEHRNPEPMEKFKPWDGRPLTEAEREILTVVAEECNEVAAECNAVAIKVSKLLRFGANQTNPVTLVNNSYELSGEVGDLSIMIERFMALPDLFHRDSYLAGRERKVKKLARFLQHSEGCTAEGAPVYEAFEAALVLSKPTECASAPTRDAAEAPVDEQNGW